MRESIGGSWLFSLIIIFILLFTAFLAVTINYARAFKVKNDVIDIIEREEGLTSKGRSTKDPGAVELIDNYLMKSGYKNNGTCPEGSLGEGKILVSKNDNDKYKYCVSKHNSYDNEESNRSYYKVTLFFKMDLPIFGEFLTFRATGETTEIYYPADCYQWGEC